jgi:hypothetical protein
MCWALPKGIDPDEIVPSRVYFVTLLRLWGLVLSILPKNIVRFKSMVTLTQPHPSGALHVYSFGSI